ncbi:hypothetical protein HDU99_000034 [Rhizoclosmatium hyalinum]|nr:hypothetical protein HDU99_000034 [Rhizoclosmatium hyalinum]
MKPSPRPSPLAATRNLGRPGSPSDTSSSSSGTESDDDDARGTSDSDFETTVATADTRLQDLPSKKEIQLQQQQQQQQPLRNTAPTPADSPPAASTATSVAPVSGLRDNVVAAVAAGLGADLADLAPLIATHSAKSYARGFVYALVAPFSAASTALPPACPISRMSTLGWAKYWAELNGSRLSLYLVPEVSSKITSHLKSSAPFNLSLSNALAEILPFGFQPTVASNSTSAPPPTPYDICIAINTNASNLVYFALRSSIAANHWVTGIRLSQYEASKINYHVTLRRLGSTVSTPSNDHDDAITVNSSESEAARAWKDVGLVPFKTSSVGQVKGFGTPMHFEGWVRVRVGYAQNWQMLYGVVGNVTVAGDYDGDGNGRGSAQPKKKEENRKSFLKLFNKPSKAAASAAAKKGNGDGIDGAGSTNIFLAAAGGAGAFRTPDVAFYESQEAYRSGEVMPIFRLENVSQASLDYASYFGDSFADLCEAEGHCPSTTFRDGARLPAVRLQGHVLGGTQPSITLDRSQSQQSPSSNKSFLYAGNTDASRFQHGYDYMTALMQDTDPRPVPECIHLVPVVKTGAVTSSAGSSLDTFRWITATLGAFHLETNMIAREMEFREGDLGIKPFNVSALKGEVSSSELQKGVTPSSSPLIGLGGNGSGKEFGGYRYAVETGFGGWGLLYLKTDEVAGLSQAPPETGATAKKMFESVLMDKKAARKSGFLDRWVDAVGKGVDARVVVERNEVLEKVKGLIQWLEGQQPPQQQQQQQQQQQTLQLQQRSSVALESGVDNGENSPQEVTLYSRGDEEDTVEKDLGGEEDDVETPTNDRNIQLGQQTAPLPVPMTPQGQYSAGASLAPDLTNHMVPSPSDSGKAPAPEIVKTDLVLVAVPTMQPDGTWAWQYQFANQSSVENGAVVANASPPRMKATPKMSDVDGDEDEDDDEDEDEDDDSDDNISLAASMHSASNRNSMAFSAAGLSALQKRMSSASLAMSDVSKGSFMPVAPPSGMMMANQLNNSYGIPMMGPAGMMMVPPGHFLAPGVIAGPGKVSPAQTKKKKSRLSKAIVTETEQDDDDDDDDAGSQSDESVDEEDEDEEDEDDEYDEDEDDEDDEDGESVAEVADFQQMGMMNPMMMMPGFAGFPVQMMPGMPNFPPGTVPMMQFPPGVDLNQFAPVQQQHEEQDEDKPFKIYQENSLLAQLPDKSTQSPNRRPPGGSGPLVSLPTDVKAAQEKALKLRTYELEVKKIGLGGSSDVNAVEHLRQRFDTLAMGGVSSGLATNSHKLHVPPPKPKIEGGLLAEVDKWEKEKDALKKLGAYRPSMMMPPSTRPVSGVDQLPPRDQFPRDQYGRPVSTAIDPQTGMPYNMQPPPQMQPPQPYGYPGMHPPPAGPYHPGYYQQGMYPPQAQYGYPPQQMPPNGYAYSEYGYENGWEDPALAANHVMLREQWLETERIKERQRMMERGELPQEGKKSGSENSSAQKKAAQKGRTSRISRYDSDDSEEIKVEESSGTESSDNDDNEVNMEEEGSDTSSDRQSLASRKQKVLSKRQSAAISARGTPKIPSDGSDNFSRASSGGVLLQPGIISQPPNVPMPMDMQADYHNGPSMPPYQRPPPHPAYGQMPHPGMYYQQSMYQPDPYNPPRPYPGQAGPYGGAMNPAFMPQPPQQIAGPSGREMIGERKRPTLPIRNASEAAAEEEAERKERERERRRRLRRRGVEVEESEEELDNRNITDTPRTASPAPIQRSQEDTQDVVNEPQVRTGKNLLDPDELDKILEKASRQRAARKQKETDDEESSSDEEIVIVRRKKKKGKKPSKE